MTTIQSEYILHAKTIEAYRIKILLEILCNTVKQCYFNIDASGIKMVMFDQFRNVLVSFELQCDGFNLYKFNYPEDSLNITFTTSHLYKMLKSSKKKDVLELCIFTNKPDQLTIKTSPKDLSRITESTIHTHLSQNIQIETPYVDLSNSILIQSPEFNKMIKDIYLIGSDVIKISSTDECIKFEADADGIMNRNVIFGTPPVNDAYRYSADFSHDRLTKISKIASLGEVIHFYTSDSASPVKIKTRIGDIGILELYIKSNHIIDEENK